MSSVTAQSSKSRLLYLGFAFICFLQSAILGSAAFQSDKDGSEIRVGKNRASWLSPDEAWLGSLVSLSIGIYGIVLWINAGKKDKSAKPNASSTPPPPTAPAGLN
jgi:hypothetical protein